jgi:hypothetical protein
VAKFSYELVSVDTKNYFKGSSTKIIWETLSYLMSTGIKRQEREAKHSLPPTAETKNKLSYTSTPLCAFIGVDRDMFTLFHCSSN